MSVTSYSRSVIQNGHVYKFLRLYKKIQILAQNPKVLAFAFTEKSRFLTKTDRNSIFHVQDSNIPDQLYIMVLYIIFTAFKKIQCLAQNPTVLAFGFIENNCLQ
jgi:hypothetical protein